MSHTAVEAARTGPARVFSRRPISSVVTHVPILVPKMMPNVREKGSSLAFTMPMAITVTAVLLCRKAVVAVPTARPCKGVAVERSSMWDK
ncbi:hypothetical protein D3C78_1066770 [compost metagenome]